MKDSTDNKELDQYGVWVKTPPKDSEKKGTESDLSKESDSSLPDFSFLDNVASNLDSKSDSSEKKGDFETEDTSLTADELSNIAGSASKPENSSGEQEISLDDFITGGFSDEPKAEEAPAKKEEAPVENKNNESQDSDISLDEFISDTPSEKNSQSKDNNKDGDIPLDDFLSAPSANESSEVSLDDFMDTSHDAKEQKAEEITDEKPMDINISFDDSMNSAPAQEEEPEITEQIPEASEAPKDTASEEIDLSSFDVPSDNNIASANNSSDTASTPKTNVESKDTESIDLSEFGIDSDAAETNVVLPGNEAKEKAHENVDYDMNVSTDDNTQESQQPVEEAAINSDQDESVKIETEPDTESTSAAESNGDTASAIAATAPAADDFDIDEIMNSVKDEQGKTVCIGNTADAITKDVDDVALEETKELPEQIKPETIQDLNTSDSSSEPSISNTIPESMVNEDAEKQEQPSDKIEEDGIEENTVESIPDFLPDDIADSIEPVEKAQDADESSQAFENVKIEEPKLTESKEDEDFSKENRAILDNIANELSSLKNEISGLKNEFEDLKKNKTMSSDASTKKEEKAEGFFSGTDEDETIALSGDELNNILNNADFTTTTSAVEEATPVNEEPAEEPVPVKEAKTETPTSDNPLESLNTLDNSIDIPETEEYESDNGLKMDFTNEKLEEPVFDNLDLNSQVDQDTQNENDISVPKVDDILVESSNTDLMDSSTNSSVKEPEPEEPAPIEDAEPVEEATPVENEKHEDISKPINLFKEEEPAPITEDNINYLSEDGNNEDVNNEEDEAPVDSVFNQWDDNKKTEENFEEPEPVAEAEPVAEEPEPIAEAEPAKSNDTNSSIPSDMKQEIKSVLSYMDQLLENLPEDKITEFAQSKQFETYKKLFNELGLA